MARTSARFAPGPSVLSASRRSEAVSTSRRTADPVSSSTSRCAGRPNSLRRARPRRPARGSTACRRAPPAVAEHVLDRRRRNRIVRRGRERRRGRPSPARAGRDGRRRKRGGGPETGARRCRAGRAAAVPPGGRSRGTDIERGGAPSLNCARPSVGFPSGQRGRAVNPLAQPSQVRILLPPLSTEQRACPTCSTQGDLAGTDAGAPRARSLVEGDDLAIVQHVELRAVRRRPRRSGGRGERRSLPRMRVTGSPSASAAGTHGAHEARDALAAHPRSHRPAIM